MSAMLPQSASSYGPHVDGVIGLIFGIVGVWFLIALGTLLYFAIRYRRVEGRRAAYVPGNTLRQLAFVLVPCALVLGFDLAIDAVSAKVWEEIKVDLPEGDLVVRVKSQQFVWTFVHPGKDGALDTADDVVIENNLHVPAGKTIHFELTSQDVIHSFCVPNFRLKQDAVPGRTFRGWFRATRPGTYQIVCAELCGIGHTNMRGWLHVHDEAGYAAWLDEEEAAR